MATVLTLLAGMFGFVTALLGYVVFDLSALSALGIWSLSGIVVTVLAIGFSLLGRATQQNDPFHELA